MFFNPIKKFNANPKAEGDKSLSHRLLIVAALSRGKSVLKNISLCRDVLATANCLTRLGAKIKIRGRTALVSPITNTPQNTVLDCQNSGATARLLAGVVAGLGVGATFLGDKSLSKRPMNMLAALEQMGAKIAKEEGVLFKILPSSLKGIDYAVKDNSAQTKSCVMFAALLAKGESVIREEERTRDHTERVLSFFAPQPNLIKRVKGYIYVTPHTPLGKKVFIPNDISTACYYMALAAFKGKTKVKKVLVNPLRTGFLRALMSCGADIKISSLKSNGFEEYADITVQKSLLSPLEGLQEPLSAFIDEVPLLCFLLANTNGGFEMDGLSRLAGKESDRIKTTAQMLNSVGYDCAFSSDALSCRGGENKGGKIKTCGDHRIALTSCVIAALSKEGAEVDDIDCIGISSPRSLALIKKCLYMRR